jgi:hypothetical protein
VCDVRYFIAESKVRMLFGDLPVLALFERVVVVTIIAWEVYSTRTV